MKFFSNTLGVRLESEELKKQVLTPEVMLQVKGGEDDGSGFVRNGGG